jgi:ACS family pantothenate transporter-like MFS transporter
MSHADCFLRWANEVCSDDDEERALVVATINTIQYVQGAWLQLIIWKQTDSPRYKKGFPTAVAFSFVVIGIILLIRHLAKREAEQ